MSWGTITIGGIPYRETIVASGQTGTLHLAGQESHPPSTRVSVITAHLNVLALRGAAAVPVVFTDKTDLTGFYAVTDSSSDLLRFANGIIQTATWQMTLEPLGNERDVEFESRISMIARATDLVGQTPVFWHAPPPGATSYYTGATVPSGSLVRHSADGDITVFTGLPAAVSPRWACPAAGYLGGSSRILLDTIRRAGGDTPQHAVWEINNGIVQVIGGGDASFTVAAWSGFPNNVWESVKAYVPTVNGVAVTGTPEFTIIRNDPEQVIVRLSYPTLPGRVTVDLSIRRGARLVTGVIKRQASATLGIARTAAETAAVVTGGLRASAVDADGNRFVMGSSKTLSTVTGTAAISKAAVTSLDFFLGHEFGSPAAAGDAFADLLVQYLGTSGDQTRLVRR